MSNIMVRARLLKDIDNGLLECLNALGPTSFAHSPEWVMIDRDCRGARDFVAVNGKQVIGTISLVVERKLLHGGGYVGHIEDVAVHPEHQQKGVGRLLVQHAIDYCRHMKCYKVILNCKETVVPFYAKLGFHRHEVAMRLDLRGEQ